MIEEIQIAKERATDETTKIKSIISIARKSAFYEKSRREPKYLGTKLKEKYEIV